MVVLVLTSNRQGSSTVARLLHNHFGVFMGREFVDFGPHPEGTYEDEEFKRIHEGLLTGLSIDEHIDGLKRLIDKRNFEHDHWGVKGGILSFLMGFYFDLLEEDPVLIRCRRNIHDTCKSWVRTWENCSYLNAVLEVTVRERCLDDYPAGRLVHDIWFDERKSDDQVISELETILFDPRHSFQIKAKAPTWVY